MKNQTIYLLLFVLFTFAISCSSDDEDLNPITELVCGENTTNYSGTICCVTGSDLVTPGETLSFDYNSNIINPVFTWEVVSGSITIISGENSPTITVEFGNDFTTGMIRGKAIGDEVCTEVLTINKR